VCEVRLEEGHPALAGRAVEDAGAQPELVEKLKLVRLQMPQPRPEFYHPRPLLRVGHE
jgi:hypothetical protein